MPSVVILCVRAASPCHLWREEKNQQKNHTDNSARLHQVLLTNRLFQKYPSKCKPRKGLWEILAVDKLTGQYLRGTDPNAWLTYHCNFGRVYLNFMAQARF